MGATHLDVYVDKIKLNNQSEAVCALNCRYKDGVDGEQKRTGVTDSFPVGQNKTLDLNSLPELNELYNKGREIYVTAYVDVKAGKDDYADIWVKYKPNSEKGVEFTTSRVINFTNTRVNGSVYVTKYFLPTRLYCRQTLPDTRLLQRKKTVWQI